MVEAWIDVNGLEAEARLRGLRRRLSELDAALTDQQALLRDYPGSFSLLLSTKGLSRMDQSLRHELVEILRHRENEKIEMVLDGRNFAHNSARFSDLGILFSRLQKLYSSIAQAITSGPTLRGPISASVRAATDLRLNATFMSSFGMEVYVPSSYDLLGTSIVADALEQMFQLLNAAATEQRLVPVSGMIGRRALVHLRSLADLLKKTDSSMRLGWKDFTGTHYDWILNRATSDSVIRSIDNIMQTRSDTRNVSGILVGASLLRSRFEIILDGGTLIEGKFVAGLGKEIRDAFGMRISAVVDETEITDRASGDVRTFHALKAIGPPS